VKPILNSAVSNLVNKKDPFNRTPYRLTVFTVERKVEARSEKTEVYHAEAFPQERNGRFCWLRKGPLFALT
jgi:hypothetical protein